MTEQSVPSPGLRGERAGPAGRQVARRILIRAVIHTVGLVGAFYLFPVRADDPDLLLRTLGSTAILVIVFVWQVRAVVRAEVPFAQGLIGLSLAVPLMVVLYAGLYLVSSVQDAAAFTEPLGRTDALYFTMTVMSTVGFGDISPSSEWARILTMTQMVATITILGFAANTVFSLVGSRRQQHDEPRS